MGPEATCLYMETPTYFTTDQVKAKNWDMLQEAKALRGRRAALEAELKKFAASWAELGRECRDAHGRSFRMTEKDLSILNPSQGMLVIGKVQREHFDWDVMGRLFADIEETETALRKLEKQLADIGA
jgi:hypothetical protein